MYTRRARLRIALTALLLVSAADARAQTAAVTSPKQQFGFNIGDDYQLANYKQFVEYWQQARRGVGSHDGRRDRQDGRGPRRS